MIVPGAEKTIRAEKISLNVSPLLVNPACQAGVRTSRPNFNARWDLKKLCSDSAAIRGDLRDVASTGLDLSFGDPHTPSLVGS
jgi:hypothetical protein